jgi:hypothetical protein
MGKYNDIVGIRDKDTNRLIVFYPEKVSGTDEEIENKVKFWYYQKDCGAEHRLEHYYVGNLTTNELQALK